MIQSLTRPYDRAFITIDYSDEIPATHGAPSPERAREVLREGHFAGRPEPGFWRIKSLKPLKEPSA